MWFLAAQDSLVLWAGVGSVICLSYGESWPNWITCLGWMTRHSCQNRSVSSDGAKEDLQVVPFSFSLFCLNLFCSVCRFVLASLSCGEPKAFWGHGKVFSSDHLSSSDSETFCSERFYWNENIWSERKKNPPRVRSSSLKRVCSSVQHRFGSSAPKTTTEIQAVAD